MNNIASPSHQYLSSHLVKGFDKVVISAAAKCTCGKSIRPHDARHNDDVIEIICSGCHKTFLAVGLAEELAGISGDAK